MLTSSWPPRSPAQWLAFAAAALLLSLTAYALTSYAMSRELGSDVAAYWNAAERLRAGQELYAPGAANASDLYRYSPWFAYAWVPFTALPRDAVATGWVGLMLVAAAASTLPLLARGPVGIASFALLAPLQVQGAMFGNVQPLLVLALLWGVERRSGPIWIALGASLKAVPLLLALVYIGRGEWRRAAVAVAVTAVLVLPAFAFDLSGYSVEPGPNQLSLAGVWLPMFVLLALAACTAALLLARGRYAWLGGALAMLATLPRLLTYEIGFLLVALATKDRSLSRGTGHST